jgi:hypothetical protein
MPAIASRSWRCAYLSRRVPVIEDEDIDPREARHHGRVRPVTMRGREFRKETRNAPVDHALSVAAGLLFQGAGEKRLADTDRAVMRMF